jgi:hypothetical protein
MFAFEDERKWQSVKNCGILWMMVEVPWQKYLG